MSQGYRVRSWSGNAHVLIAQRLELAHMLGDGPRTMDAVEFVIDAAARAGLDEAAAKDLDAADECPTTPGSFGEKPTWCESSDWTFSWS